ncbi:MAG: Ni/Fe-hydrogenase, b-type cytochrome subunit [Acidobacteria bacterium]|nr:Ni/Fe-hydrogenase, b-type cytochrome subunit [Acidobacteriota bacterium]
MATTLSTLKFEPGEPRYGRRYVWELPVRLSHWLTVAAIITLFWTGLYISAPQLSTAGEPWQHFVMGNIRMVHFISGYVLLISFLIRSYWFWVGNNYSRSGFPFVLKASWWADLKSQAMQYLRLERGHVHLGHNALGGLTYTIFVIGLGWFQILTGLALYSESNPGGFWSVLTGWIIPLCGGSMQVRMWHHTMAWGFVVFAILHIYIVMFDSGHFNNGLISSIVSGFKFWEEGDLDNDRWVS